MELFCSKYNCSNTKPKRVCRSPYVAEARATLPASRQGGPAWGSPALLQKDLGVLGNTSPFLEPQLITRMKTSLVTLVPSMPAHFSDLGSSTNDLGSLFTQILKHLPYSAVIYLSINPSPWETVQTWRTKARPRWSLYFQWLTQYFAHIRYTHTRYIYTFISNICK